MSLRKQHVKILETTCTESTLLVAVDETNNATLSVKMYKNDIKNLITSLQDELERLGGKIHAGFKEDSEYKFKYYGQTLTIRGLYLKACRYIAFDDDGAVYIYENKPMKYLSDGNFGMSKDLYYHIGRITDKIFCKIHWSESLVDIRDFDMSHFEEV